MYGGEEMFIQGFGGETWGKRYHLEDLDIDGRDNIKMNFHEVEWEDMEWVDLA
jgi:hypothetical protein